MRQPLAASDVPELQCTQVFPSRAAALFNRGIRFQASQRTLESRRRPRRLATRHLGAAAGWFEGLLGGQQRFETSQIRPICSDRSRGLRPPQALASVQVPRLNSSQLCFNRADRVGQQLRKLQTLAEHGKLPPFWTSARHPPTRKRFRRTSELLTA